MDILIDILIEKYHWNGVYYTHSLSLVNFTIKTTIKFIKLLLSFKYLAQPDTPISSFDWLKTTLGSSVLTHPIETDFTKY